MFSGREIRNSLRGLLILSSVALSSLLSLSVAEAASPAIKYLSPPGLSRGQEMEIKVVGQRLNDPQAVLFYRPGIEVLSVAPDPKNGNACLIKLKCAADCELGEYPFRLQTKSGVTNLRPLFVGAYPCVEAKEPNNKFDEPQVIPMGSSVYGKIDNEDVDYFRVSAKKGERISVEVMGFRLGVALFDPYVAILDKNRFEIASNDDTSLTRRDSFLSVIAPEDGDYVIQLRETAFGGNGDDFYWLHVGNFPRPSVAYPSGGKPGEEIEVRLLGDVSGEFKQKVKLPANFNGNYPLIPQQNGVQAPTPVYLRVDETASVMEDEKIDNNAATTGQKLPSGSPIAVHGRLEKAGDVDWYLLPAKKGEKIDVRIYARQLRSGLDPVLRVFDEKGARHIKGADDVGNNPDSMLDFDAPADGLYAIQVSDHLGRGSEEFVYRLEMVKKKPELELTTSFLEPNARVGEYLSVPKGNRSVVLMRVQRTSVGGANTIEIPQLPEGVKATIPTIPANLDMVPVVLEAAPEAKIAGILATPIVKSEDGKFQGRFRQNVDILFENNQRKFYEADVYQLPITVSEEIPVKIEAIAPKAPLVQGGETKIKVKVERQGDFKGNVTLRMPYRPAGISASGTVNVPPEKGDAEYPMNATGNAPTGEWPMIVTATVDLGKGPVWISTPVFPLKVTQPFVTMKLEQASIEQGQSGEVIVKLDQKTPFEGKAKVQLLGLPFKVTANEVEIDKTTTEVIFNVATDKASPVGKHNLFCRLTVPVDGELSTGNTGHGGVLRINPPPKAPANPKPVAKKEEPKKKEEKAAPKRLSRLEMLRQQASDNPASGK